MKRSKFTEQQIAFALKQAELGTPVEEVCRKMGISDATFYNWKKKYGGLGPSELRRLEAVGRGERQAQAAGGGLEPGQDHAAGRVVKKALKPSRKRILIDELRNHYRASLRQTCALLRDVAYMYVYKSPSRDGFCCQCAV